MKFLLQSVKKSEHFFLAVFTWLLAHKLYMCVCVCVCVCVTWDALPCKFIQIRPTATAWFACMKFEQKSAEYTVLADTAQDVIYDFSSQASKVTGSQSQKLMPSVYKVL